MNSTARQFKTNAAQITRDLRHRKLVNTALENYAVKRDEKKGLFQDWQAARKTASAIKQEAIDQLDQHLTAFVSRMEERGTKVHWAQTAQRAREIIVSIAKAKRARMVIKSKSMTSEEIHLNEALEKAGVEVIESDLGEFIVQLRDEPPYHIVFPAMHLTRNEISDLFSRKLGTPPTSSPEELTMIARRVLRQKYLQADIGLTGANFAVAETGMISITENEGNSRLTSAMPPVMITLLGIEKIVPRLSDLAIFLPMLATVGAGQLISGYNTLYSGPRQPGETDGPEEYHVVLLDNRRTQLLGDPEQRDALHCIRCGACLNVCPIYRNVGGHTYDTTYPGPIGSVITPHLRGLLEWKHLSYASSLCGACTEACPVQVKLHHHLLQNRRNANRQKPAWWETTAFRLFAYAANRPSLWHWGQKLGWFAQKFHPLIKGTILDPARPWTKTRDLPPIARENFRDYWRKRS